MFFFNLSQSSSTDIILVVTSRWKKFTDSLLFPIFLQYFQYSIIFLLFSKCQSEKSSWNAPKNWASKRLRKVKMLFMFAILISRMCTRVVVYNKIGGNISVLWFRSPVDFLLWLNSSNIINMKDKCLRKKFDVSKNILELFFLPFRANYGFPVVVHEQPGRKEYGNVRARGNPVSVHEKWTRWIYHFFLAMVLRSRGPLAARELR